MGHARLSPSDSARWLNCPGAIALCKDLEEEEKYNEYAEEGTAAHELGELCLQSLEAKPEDFLGQGLNPHPVHKPDGWIVDKDMCKHINTYINYVYEQIDIHNDYLEIEKKVKLFYSPEETGTSDVVAINEETSTLHVIDLKYGQGVGVEALGNSQLLIYGASTYDEVMEFGLYEIEHVVIHIVQPRTGNICSATYTVEEIEAFKKVVIGVVENIKAGTDHLVPGEKQCRWCPASGICKAQAKAHVEALTMDFDDLDKPPCDVNLLSVTELAGILAKRKSMENWLGSLEQRCYDKLYKGEEIPGFKLVAGQTRRKWVDEKETEKFLRDRLKKDEIFNSKLITPSQAEEKLGKMATRSKNRFDDLYFKPEGAAKIAPESDRRPVIKKYEEMFDDLDEL